MSQPLAKIKVMHDTASPTYTCLPGLIGAISEAPATVLRQCLIDLCKTSATDAQRATKALSESSRNLFGPPGQVQQLERQERREDPDHIEVLLEQALEARKTLISSKAYRIERERHFDELDEREARENQAGSDHASQSSCDDFQIVPTESSDLWGSKGLAVDDIGPSGRCSSYSYSKNPRCVTRTDKAYLDQLRAKLDADPSRSREPLISAERKLEKDRLEFAFCESMRAIESIPARYEKCQNCKEDFDVNWNDYESCTWHPGTLDPDYDGFWPKKWDREDEECECDFEFIDMLIRAALGSDNKDEHIEAFKWDCCQKNGVDEGCETGKHVAPRDDANSAKHKRRKIR